MKFYRTGWIVPLLLLVLNVPAFAQSSNANNIPYVDLSTAQTLVETLSKENDSLAADVVTLKKQVGDTTTLLTNAKKSFSDFSALQGEVKDRTADLASILQELVDRGNKAKALTALTASREADRKVRDKISELMLTIGALPGQIESLRYQIALDYVKIARNTQEIIMLSGGAILRTKAQEVRLTTMLSENDATLAKVDSYLQQAAAATATTTKK